MSYTIRSCEQKDLDQLIDLCAAHAAYEKSWYTSEGKKEKLERALFSAHPSLHCWVVEEDYRLTGYVTFTFDYSTWDGAYFLHMDCLYLTEENRGRGIGKKIIQRLQAVAAQKGCCNIQWQTPLFNEQAIRFYQKNGATGKNKVRFTLEV